MRATGIVQRYYGERLGYMGEVIEGIRGSGVEDVVVWDNSGGGVWGKSGERVGKEWGVESSRNTLLGRYGAAVMAETEYVFVQDDDLVVGDGVVGRLLEVAEREKGKIVGVSGCLLARGSGRPYTEGKWVQEGAVDVVLGRCWAAHRGALVAGLGVVMGGEVWPGRSDDIVFSMAGGGGLVVGGCEVRNLEEGGVGLSWEAGHFEERDQMARKMIVMGY